MFINFERQRIHFPKIDGDNFNTSEAEDHEKYIMDFVRDWNGLRSAFKFQTSGSTGTSKIITLSKDILEYSAKATLEYLNIENGGSSLLCISPQFIGGTMVIVRSLINDMDIWVQKPLGRPVIDRDYDLTSMVPMQVENLLKQDPASISLLKCLLIGGAPLSVGLEQSLVRHEAASKIYVTYGMTETASHIALRPVGDPIFTVMGDTEIKVDETECLQIRGSVTEKSWIQTNDIVELQDEKSFIWKGRRDFVINTGGLKVSPETIEAMLHSYVTHPFLVSYLPDKKLGQRIILITEKVAYNGSFDMIPNKYQRPKESHVLDQLEYTASGKIDRNASRHKLIEQITS